MKREKFLDIRTHNFVRIAATSPRVFLADPKNNATEHFKVIREVYDQGAQVVVFPELSLTGYSCQDLFLQKKLQEEALSALKLLLTKTRDLRVVIVVGLPLAYKGKIFNVAAILFKGDILALYPKSYLPDYSEFREARWFSVAKDADFETVNLFGRKVPFGTDLLIKSEKLPDFILAADICEDLWVSVPPSTIAALNGATILVNSSGSNSGLQKDDYRKQLVISSSAKNLAIQVYSSAGFGESTTDLSWDGQCLIAERGRLLAESKRFSLKSEYVIADVDLDLVIHDRKKIGSFAKNSRDYKTDFREVTIKGNLGKGSGLVYQKLVRKVDPHPFVPTKNQEWKKRCEDVFDMQTTSLARRMLSLPKESRKLVIGISGGMDSTLALLVATRTMDLLGISRKKVIAMTMPGFGTSKRTYKNACALANSLGVTFKKVPIKALSTQVLKHIGHDSKKADIVFENTQAWARKYLELATAGKERGIVLGTGDLSELMLGWTTMYGDHASHYGINSGVPKSLVSELIKWSRDNVFAKEDKVRVVLKDVLATPISPELLPPDKKGNIAQKTQEIIGPYELHDFFIYWFVRFGLSPVKISRLALAAFEGKYTLAEIKKWLAVFIKRFFASQYKRSVLPDGPKVGSVSPSPRDDLKIPSDITNPSLWLANLREIPAADL